MVEKDPLLQVLKRQKKATLLELLEHAFDRMDNQQRRAVFGTIAKKPSPARVGGKALLEQVRQFHRDSLNRRYYAPFMINSKNFRHIPDETEEWFERVGDLLKGASKLTHQGDHAGAVACFDLLFELIEAMEDGREIVFAEECGSWMIPAEEKVWVADYLASLAATEGPDTFATKALPLIERDSCQSFCAQVYKSALKVANKDQAARVKAEVQRQRIRTGPDPRRPM